MTNQIKCPNCGSTAPVSWLWGSTPAYKENIDSDYICGCGCEFTTTHKIAEVAITKSGRKIKMDKEKIYCPVNAWDCPYWKKDGSCSMVDDGFDPAEECDDYIRME